MYLQNRYTAECAHRLPRRGLGLPLFKLVVRVNTGLLCPRWRCSWLTPRVSSFLQNNTAFIKQAWTYIYSDVKKKNKGAEKYILISSSQILCQCKHNEFHREIKAGMPQTFIEATLFHFVEADSSTHGSSPQGGHCCRTVPNSSGSWWGLPIWCWAVSNT